MKKKVQVSHYYDEQDNDYYMIECYYDDFFCYVIDYSNIGNGHYDVETIYNHIAYDVPHHALPIGLGYSDNMYIVDYAYYLDFQPIK